MRIIALIVVLVCLWGCQLPSGSLPAVVASAPVELHLGSPAPIDPRGTLLPLGNPDRARRYLAWDLNADGVPEYFVEDSSGAHSVNFALTDSRGNLLIAPEDMQELGGDRILILASAHGGYHDLVSSSCDLWTVMETRWQFDGTRYVQAGHRTYELADPAERRAAFIEARAATTLAKWYVDVWSRPRDVAEAGGVKAVLATK